MKKLIFLLIALLINSASAKDIFDSPDNNSGSKFDYNSGNFYRWQNNDDGETKIYGNNYKTGSTWNTTVEENGDMRGRDSNGNVWNYNDRTGTYINYGTGEMRNKRYGW